MKKLILVLLLVGLFPLILFAERRIELVSETTGAINTTATAISIPNNGCLAIFTDAKLYYTLEDTATPDSTSYQYLTAGQLLDTEMYFYTSETIGLLSDSGTANYVLTVYREYTR